MLRPSTITHKDIYLKKDPVINLNFPAFNLSSSKSTVTILSKGEGALQLDF